MKKISVITAAMILIISVISGCTVIPASSPDKTDTEYGGGLFDPSEVHVIDIRIAPEDWTDLLENPQDKTKYRTDITIDGEETENVSCSAKGNSSLIMVRELYGIDRYSLKIDFGKFEKGRTVHNIRKFNLNNSFRDSTYMKDFLCYTMFRKAGVDAPLCSYAWVTVNGEDYGLFQVVEEIDEHFMERTGWEGGVLYKPESDKLAADNEDLRRIIVNGVQAEDYSEGAELGYRGESIEDYPDIFKNAETKADDEDKQRVIRALKELSEGTDPDRYLYRDELVRYFAVQNFVLNHDGYSGSFLHNYYLCEKDGRLAMFPWDYNMAFASRWAQINPEQSDAVMLANYGIDTPLLGAEPENRPMWKWIADHDPVKEDYHRAMGEFIAGYFESGEFGREMDSLIEMLLPYVEKDPTAFCSAEQFSAAAEALREFCLFRAESVRRQLNGELSAETQNQSLDGQVDVPGTIIRDLA